MKKGKKIFIFTLINIIVILVAVVIPFIPAIKMYNAYHYEIPKVGNNSFVQNMGVVVKQLDTQEEKIALTDFINFGIVNRGEMFYNNFVWLYIMFGVIIAVLIITLGIVLKYKCENKIYLQFLLINSIIYYSFIWK